MADRRKKGQWPEIVLAGRPGWPALVDWVSRMNETAEGLSVVPRASAITGFSEPTVRSGGPAKPAERKRFVDRLDASVQRRLMHGASANAVLSAHVRNATCPPVFAIFAGGYSTRMMEICDAMDRISEALATCTCTRSDASQAVVEVGAVAAARAGLQPVSDDLVALDATLLVLACLDMEVLLNHQDRRYPARSLFRRVSPRMKGGQVKRWPYARLLDRLYLLIGTRRGYPIGERPPTIARLDAVLGTATSGGTKSPVTKWRTGRVMRRSAYEDIVTRSLPNGPERFVADKLYAGATFWHVLVGDAPEHVEWALERFDAWWSLFRPEGFAEGAEDPSPIDVLA